MYLQSSNNNHNDTEESTAASLHQSNCLNNVNSWIYSTVQIKLCSQ